MAKFLNTDLINKWIPKLINESEKELFIIVPYIKTSDLIFNHLSKIDSKGIEITLIYRENNLSQAEKNKLNSLKNLNLLCHPNVHAKCYYNGKLLIICSMNLYEYSERNNREMGILLFQSDHEENNSYSNDDENICQDAILEMQNILNSSDFQKYSIRTKSGNFKKSIIKSKKDLAEEECQLLNQVFIHKKFEAFGFDHHWSPKCTNYFDRIDLMMEHRAVLSFTLEEERVERIFRSFQPFCKEGLIEGFKLYWNHHTGNITLYRNQKHPMWHNISSIEDLKQMKRGIDELITQIKQHIIK